MQSEEYFPAHSETYDKSVDVCGVMYKVVVTEVECRDPLARQLWPMFMRAKDGFVLVYDVTCAASLAFAAERHAELVRERGTPCVPAVLVGNEADASAATSNRAVSTQEGADLAERLGCAFFEASARDGTNVHEAVVAAAAAALRDKTTNGTTRKEKKEKYALM